MSAWIPAPPEGSQPPIVNAVFMCRGNVRGQGRGDKTAVGAIRSTNGDPIMSSTTATKTLPPLHVIKWIEHHLHKTIEQHRNEMKPPVSNKYLYDGEDFFVMIINGPNARNDFHVTNSEEFFYQLKGDIVVRIVEDGQIKDMIVREGNTFFVPGNVPHSPTRPPGTLGMVIER